MLQLAGAVAGALLTKFLLIDQLADQQSVGTPSVNLSLLGSTFAGVIAEGVGTFFLVWAVVAVAVNPRAARDWAGLVIGGTLGFGVLVFGPLTGAALNPARWFGPAFVDAIGENTTGFDDFWVYIIGPIAGGVLARARLLVPVRRGSRRSCRDAGDRPQGPAPGRHPAPVGTVRHQLSKGPPRAGPSSWGRAEARPLDSAATCEARHLLA